MRISDAQKEYVPLLPPVDKPFCELNKAEADAHFAWYLSYIDQRSEYLRSKVSQGLCVPIEQIDYSLDSTILVWRWFLQVAALQRTPGFVLRRMRKAIRGQPNSFIRHIIDQKREELSVFSEYALRDIGMYISKLFLTNYPCLRWTIRYKPKSDVNVNLPLVVGFVDDNPSYPKPFHPELEPTDFARTPAMNLFEGTQKDTDLFDRCRQWIAWIPEESDDAEGADA